MADQTNPFTQYGMMQMLQPNRFISPQYQNNPLPVPGFNPGATGPTDAQGNPIASYGQAQNASNAWNAANPAPAAPTQGTTLNSNPGGYVNPALRAGNNAAGLQALSSLVPTGGGNFAAGPGTPQGFWQQAGQGQQQPAAAPAQNPVDMRQAYLTALSNPGKVTTPGANVPIKAPLGTPSVLQSFLAANPGGGSTTAGGFSNKPFFNTLNNLQGSAT